jgi:hypothetical protein
LGRSFNCNVICIGNFRGALGYNSAIFVINSEVNILLNDYYIINGEYPDRYTAATDIQQVYWTKNEGLVAYKYVDGTFWVKKEKK